jgi:hypothetical protein
VLVPVIDFLGGGKAGGKFSQGGRVQSQGLVQCSNRCS